MRIESQIESRRRGRQYRTRTRKQHTDKIITRIMTPNNTNSRSSRRDATATKLLMVALVLASCLAAVRANRHFEQQDADAFASAPIRPRRSHLAARRAADDSRPLSRYASSQTQTQTQAQSASSGQDDVIVGKFMAPAPERVARQRIPKSRDSASQSVSASFRVQSADDDAQPSNQKTIHGSTEQRFGRPRTVSAKIMVSDEGLNYPPSKLSADIHGNVAEIVTAPPEAVDSDLFLPPASRLFGR